jgi:hypothetical protein
VAVGRGDQRDKVGHGFGPHFARVAIVPDDARNGGFPVAATVRRGRHGHVAPTLAVARLKAVAMRVPEAVNPPRAAQKPVALVVWRGDDLAERPRSWRRLAVELGVPMGIDIAGGVQEEVAAAIGARGHPYDRRQWRGPGVGVDVPERRYPPVGVEQPKPLTVGRRGDPFHRAEPRRGRAKARCRAVGDHRTRTEGHPATVVCGPGREADRLDDRHPGHVLHIALNVGARSRSHHDAAGVSRAGQRHRHRNVARPVTLEVAGQRLSPIAGSPPRRNEIGHTFPSAVKGT